jgi:hypothetical protein
LNSCPGTTIVVGGSNVNDQSGGEADGLLKSSSFAEAETNVIVGSFCSRLLQQLERSR